MLTLGDVWKLLPEMKGIKETSLRFHTIAVGSLEEQEKSLFFPVAEGAELLEAIHLGAVAAVWPKSKELPAYTPNHFPVFFTDDPMEALIELINTHSNKITMKKFGERTKIMMGINVMKTEREKKMYEKIMLLLEHRKNSKDENRREMQ